MRYRRATYLIFAAVTLLSPAFLWSNDGAPVSEPKTYRVTVPDLVKLDLALQKTTFTVGEPIVATKRITNISKAPFAVDSGSLSEGFALRCVDPALVCGVLADHAPGYQKQVAQIAMGATMSANYDLSAHPCFRGAGLYQATGSYCHYDGKTAVHGTTPPLWCVQSEAVSIVVVSK